MNLLKTETCQKQRKVLKENLMTLHIKKKRKGQNEKKRIIKRTIFRN